MIDDVGGVISKAEDYARQELEKSRAITKPRTFTAPSLEVERAEHWKHSHGPCVGDDKSKRWFEWRISDSTGGLGYTFKIACLLCDNWCDVTDYDAF